MPTPTAQKSRTSKAGSACNEFLSELADLIAQTLQKAHIDAELAIDTGVSVADAVADSFGGLQIYIRGNAKKDQAERDEEIIRALVTADANMVARQFGISHATVYKAVRRAQARHSNAARGWKQ